MTQGASGTWRAVAATVGACLLVTLVGWAALIGPSQVFTGPRPCPWRLGRGHRHAGGAIAGRAGCTDVAGGTRLADAHGGAGQPAPAAGRSWLPDRAVARTRHRRRGAASAEPARAGATG